MIAYLRGMVRDIGDNAVVLDVNGVGYLVHCTGRTLHQLPRAGEMTELYVRMQVREDDISLYGFALPAERAWFVLLQSIQGVGARLALAIVSTLQIEELEIAVASEDRKALTRVSGVGPRLATRILTELQNRESSLPARALKSVAHAGAIEHPSARNDAVSALINLGYGRSEAFIAVDHVLARTENDIPVDKLVREALREISG